MIIHMAMIIILGFVQYTILFSSMSAFNRVAFYLQRYRLTALLMYLSRYVFTFSVAFVVVCFRTDWTNEMKLCYRFGMFKAIVPIFKNYPMVSNLTHNFFYCIRKITLYDILLFTNVFTKIYLQPGTLANSKILIFLELIVPKSTNSDTHKTL